MSNHGFKIRCLQPGEQTLLKSLRLTALRSDPQSYWENLAEAEAYGDNYWSDLALQLVKPDGSRMFILEQDGVVSGFIYGISKDAGEYRIGGLWVDPACRGRKVWICARPTCRVMGDGATRHDINQALVAN
jgi:hypothetical protein